jgi:hypothetical protein
MKSWSECEPSRVFPQPERGAAPPSRSRRRLGHILAVLDVLVIAAGTPFFIWKLQSAEPRSWIAFAIWIAASFLVHRDTPATLGWRGDNLAAAAGEAAIALLVQSAALALAGLLLAPHNTLPADLFSMDRVWRYSAFCLLQQVLLNSFYTNRLLSLSSNRPLVSLIAGVTFAAAHWPNPVLVPCTFVIGTVTAWLFSRNRNILPLAVMQALLGTILWWSFPVAWHHRLRVGPGYYRPF